MLFKAALLLSICSFSGFSLQPQLALQKTTHTELVDLASPKTKKLKKKFTPATKSVGLTSNFHLSLLLKFKLDSAYLKNQLATRFTVNRKELLLHYNSVRNHQIKIPSSPADEEIPVFSLI